MLFVTFAHMIRVKFWKGKVIGLMLQVSLVLTLVAFSGLGVASATRQQATTTEQISFTRTRGTGCISFKNVSDKLTLSRHSTTIDFLQSVLCQNCRVATLYKQNNLRLRLPLPDTLLSYHHNLRGLDEDFLNTYAG